MPTHSHPNHDHKDHLHDGHIVEDHPGGASAIFEDVHFYEWNEESQLWIKLNNDSPDPPLDLEPGKFDGQLREA